jgi:hypothetical protein
MRPLPRAAIANDARKKKFNEQLSRAWRVVGKWVRNISSEMANVFRPIETDAETTERVLKRHAVYTITLQLLKQNLFVRFQTQVQVI